MTNKRYDIAPNSIITTDINQNEVGMNISSFTATTTSILSNNYVASGGTVTSGDTYQTAISKIDGNTTYIPLGSLFSISGNTWNTSSIGTNFTRAGANLTYNFATSLLNISGGTGVYTDFIYTSYQTNLSDFTSTLTYTHKTNNTAGTGIIHSYGSGSGIVFTLDTSISSVSKMRILDQGIDVSGLEFLDNTINILVNDIITYNVTQLKNKFIFSILVNTGGVRREYSVTWKARIYNTSELLIPVTNIGISNIGGLHNISSFSAFGKTIKNADLALVGDSYLFGYETIDNNTTLSSLIEARTSGKVITIAKPGNTIQDLINSVNEIIVLAPKVIYLNIGANSMTLTPSTIFSQLQTLVTILQTAGIKVYIGKIYPRATSFSNTQTFNNLIDTNYPSNMVVDMFNPFLNSAGTSFNQKYSNGTHSTLEGKRLECDILWNKLQNVLSPRNNYENPAMYFNQLISKTTINGYPVLQNNILPTGLNAISAITNSQTIINLPSSPSAVGFTLGYARIGYLAQVEYVKIIGIDEILNILTIVRAQLGTTNQSTAGLPYVSMCSYILTPTNINTPYHLIEQGGLHVFNGIGSFQNTHTMYVPSGSNNGLSILNNVTDGSAFVMISRQSVNANGALRFMTANGFTYDIICQGIADLSISRTGQNDIYMTGGKIGINNTNPLAKLDVNGSFASKTLRTSATTLTLDSTARSYFFGGNSGTTWTLPTISTSTNVEYYIKNTGTANITLVTQSSDLIYNNSPINNLVIPPNSAYILQNDGTYWQIM